MTQKIAIIGIGGIGSWVAMFLPYLDASKLEITLIDGDIVEEKNCLYTPFTKEDLGKNKAEVMLEHIVTDFTIKAIPRYIDEEDIAQLSKDHIIIMTTDNGVTRKWLYKYGFIFIDGRSYGNILEIFTDRSKYKETSEDSSRGSCQINPNHPILTNILCASYIINILNSMLKGEPYFKSINLDISRPFIKIEE